jgi:hypothetical protein
VCRACLLHRRLEAFSRDPLGRNLEVPQNKVMELKWAIKLFFGNYTMMSSQFYDFSSQWCVSKNAAKRTASVFP